ncbi:MAG: hypothetical protein VX589_21760 [Myxococcota bacterium]|nr:hypothetical protein [Myxococcota bacterium]
MSLLNPDFVGFEDKDFEIYQPKCWSNNRFNLDRMKTKERVRTLAESLGSVLELEGLRLEATSEVPSIWNSREVREQWAFYVRDDQARKYLQPVIAHRMDLAERIKAPADYLKHIFFGVRIDQGGLEISLRLSQYALVDVDNMLGRIETEQAELEALLTGLGDGYTIDGEAVTVSRFMTGLRELSQGQRAWLILGCILEKADVVEAGEEINARAASIASALEPIFRFCMWSQDNDHLAVGAQLDALSEAKATAAQKREEAREKKAAAHAQRAEAARARTSNKVAAEEAWRKLQAQRAPRRTEKTAAPTDRAAPMEHGEQTPAPSKTRHRTTPPRQRSKSHGPRSQSGAERRTDAGRQPKPKENGRRRTSKKAAPVFNVGDRCRLERGIFAGKEGVIAGRGKPGYYSVKVGVLEVNLSAFDITALGDE